MYLTTSGDAPIHAAPMPNGPRVTVLVGGDSGAGSAISVDVGMVRVQVPPGGGMPAHRHNGSDVILTPISGAVRVTREGEVVDVRAGDALLIPKEDSVALTNPHDDVATLIVAAGPATFVSTVRGWPRIDEEASATPA